jgi:outer membrane lipoprotein SlyB
MKKHLAVIALAFAGSMAQAGTVAPAVTGVQNAIDCKKPVCNNCGRVMGVRVTTQNGQSNALGVVGGGAAGALLGNQVGSGSGRALATIAGAVGGAYAGKAIQERSNRTKVWTVDVQYDNGKRGAFRYDHNPGVQRGDRVKKSGPDLIRM